MKVLVTGATGFVGSHLVQALLRRGDEVRIVVRSDARARSLAAAGAQVIVGDLGDLSTMRGVTEGIEVVFHMVSAMRGSDAVFEKVDVLGTQWLLSEAERTGVRRFVYPGTLAAYALAPQPDGATLNEQSAFDEPTLLGSYARAKARAEEALLSMQRRGKLEGVIVRLGLTCGAGTDVLPAHVCRVVSPNLVILFGDGSVPLPLTIVDNAVDALILAATVPGISGEAFNIVDDDVLTQREYLDLYKVSTGSSPRVLRMPRAAYYTLGAVTELAAAARRKEPATTRYRVKSRLRRVRWDCSKAHRLLQWRPRIPLREGLAQIFRAHVADSKVA